MVERAHALDRAVRELHRERAVALVEARLLGRGAEGPVGVGVVLEDAPDDVEGDRRAARPRSRPCAARNAGSPPSGGAKRPDTNAIEARVTRGRGNVPGLQRVRPRDTTVPRARKASSQAAQVLVGGHALAPSGCTSRSSTPPATSSTGSAGRARQTTSRPAVDLAPRADVRRERPDPVDELLRRARPVELAVGRADLLRVRRALLRLRLERRLRQHVVEQLDGERRRHASYTTPASSSGPIGNACCAAIGPASSSAVVRWIVTPVSASPAMIARSTGAAPRQRGRSDGWTFSQSRSSEQLLRDQRPVRGDDDRRVARELGQPLGLLHRNPQPLGRLLRGRRADLAARGRAAGRAG